MKCIQCATSKTENASKEKSHDIIGKIWIACCVPQLRYAAVVVHHCKINEYKILQKKFGVHLNYSPKESLIALDLFKSLLYGTFFVY